MSLGLGLPMRRVEERAHAIEREYLAQAWQSIDKRFGQLVVIEWVIAVGVAIRISPFAWAGLGEIRDPHIFVALGFGGLIAICPVVLSFVHPGHRVTRHATAAAQMLMVGLLVHLSGGRIEVHFGYFGLLAFLSFYYDWNVLATATGVAGLDHLLRARLWPESMYGDGAAGQWRAAEHISWILFVATVLLLFIRQGRRASFESARRQAELEHLSRDITSIVDARTAELAVSQQRYRIIFENSPLPMWLYDAHSYMFIDVNEQAVNKYGYSREEFLAMHAFDIRPPEDRDAFERSLDQMRAQTMPLCELRHRKRDGTVFDVEATSHPLEWPGRTAVLVLAYDISERKRAQREKDHLEVQLRQAQKLESIGQLAAGIAHEINTPVQYIGDNLYFLRDAFGDLSSVIETMERVLPERGAAAGLALDLERLSQAIDDADLRYLSVETPKAIDQALDGVSRISVLVKAMKEFSHPGGKEKSPADINRAIESTIVVARNEWKYVAKLETNLEPGLPLVPCLIGEINQVVLNLIVNAAHAIGSPGADGELGTITVATRSDTDHAEIRIKDSGCGIPVEIQNRIFDPFFTTKEVGKGTGQGLAIARSVIVDKHGGRIHFETSAGQGTTFVVRLPFAPATLSTGPFETKEAA